MKKKPKPPTFVIKVFVSYALLSVNTQQMGWAQNRMLLEHFAGKKITTVFNSTSTSGADESNPQKLRQGDVPVTVNKSSSTNRMEREVSIVANGRKGWKVVLTAQKIEMAAVDSEGQKSIYNSGNIFERDPMANAIGKEFDPFINKPVRVEYSNEGDNISKEGMDKKFEKFWLGQTPIFYAQALWQSHVVFPQLADIKSEINFAWVDSSSTKDGGYTTSYTITDIKDDRVVVHFQGSTTPAKSSAKQEMVTQKGSRYEGDMTVDNNTFLILKASLITINEIAYNHNGSPVAIISKKDYDITNTVSDLSKK